jgi:hypothetical protein
MAHPQTNFDPPFNITRARYLFAKRPAAAAE